MNLPARYLRPICILVFCAFLASACFPPPDLARQATVDALAFRVSSTLTAAAKPAAEDRTVETSSAKAGQASLGTPTAAEVEVPAATREAIRSILAELPIYQVDAEKGEVAWIQSNLNLETEGFNSIKVDNQHPETVVNDFVLSADITWNTRFGDSGCGFIFRSDGDQRKPSQYMVIITRLGSGHIGFTVLAKGEVANVNDIFPKNEDNSFNTENDSTNQLTIVGRGTKFQIYTNRVFVGEFDPDKPPPQLILPTQPVLPVEATKQSQLVATYNAFKALQQQEIKQLQVQRNQQMKVFNEANKDFPRGFIAMVAATQSGKVSCSFNNAWLWLIKE
ncbi:MAG TPA: hypothetical protein VMT46_04075 [Anaerolineaceae bacterium]|nr:hypothetical protein [Anaerolineaceae bacterium]